MNTDIPTISTNFIDDERMINFCRYNSNDPKCRCIIPEASIKKLEIFSYNPYYCWYSPCRNDKVFKTSLITEHMKNCNIIICTVNVGEVELDDNGKIKINNSCLSTTDIQTNIAEQMLVEEPLNDSYKVCDLTTTSFMPYVLCLLSILFLLK